VKCLEGWETKQKLLHAESLRRYSRLRSLCLSQFHPVPVEGKAVCKVHLDGRITKREKQLPSAFLLKFHYPEIKFIL
jgi:hypothetical protein